MTPYWVSVWLQPAMLDSFEYHGPWWITGERGDGACSVCAWVMATSHEGAIETLRLAIDEEARPDSLEVRFTERHKMPDRSNPSGRFKFADWMRWPWPEKPMSAETEVTPAERLSKSKKPRKQKKDGYRDARRRYPHVCRLKEKRTSLRLSLREVAEHCKASVAHLFEVEHGASVGLELALRIAAFFGCSVEELWSNKEDCPCPI